jgi:hypothetical protein
MSEQEETKAAVTVAEMPGCPARGGRDLPPSARCASGDCLKRVRLLS